jgi:hypothetical protein
LECLFEGKRVRETGRQKACWQACKTRTGK